MEDAERFRLLGKYRTPRFRIGQTVLCEVRGEMVITGMADAPIPWPIGKGGAGRHSLIVYKGPAKASRVRTPPRPTPGPDGNPGPGGRRSPGGCSRSPGPDQRAVLRSRESARQSWQKHSDRASCSP